MKCNCGYDWKHATQISPLPDNEATNIAVFDDEGPDEVVLYRTDGKRFSPCRSVSTASAKHFKSVLGAWGRTLPLLDLRGDKSKPLPAARRK
jgi:hypothetical protein